MDIPFGEWKPDYGTIGIDTLKRAFNVYASGKNYSPMKKMVSFSTPLVSKPLGSMSFIDRNGNIVTVAGDETGLYVSRGFGWQNISKNGGYNGQGQIWRFVMWGDYILATNYSDNIQAWHIGSEETFNDMSASAPRCKDFSIVNEFLVLVNTVDNYDGTRPNRIWWSPIGDPFGEWIPNATTMCDYQDIQIGSYCVGINGGSYGIIMMRESIVRMNFVGSPIAFSFETVEKNRGCVGIEAFCSDGNDIYYVSQDGFFVWNGTQSISLGTDKIDKWFFDNSELKSANVIIAAFDKIKKTVLFGYPEKGNYEKPTKMLIYGILAQRWTESFCPVTHFTQFLSKGYDLEELDEISTSIDLLPFSLDSNYYKGGVPSIGGFSDDGYFYFEGDEYLVGEIITGDIPLNSNEERSFTQRVRPILEGGMKHTLSISSKQSIMDENVFGRICNLTRLGDFTERKSGRYLSFQFNFKGNWDKAKGFSVTMVKGSLH